MAQDEQVRLTDSRFNVWSEMARQMTNRLLEAVPQATVEHIGSTSVPGLPAKPVVDMAVGVPADQIAGVTQLLVQQGFDVEGEKPHHSWLSFPGRTSRQYVIHVLEHQGRSWQRRLLFRDTLRADGAARSRYLEVKREAAASSANWDEYTNAKTAVVQSVLDAAHTRPLPNSHDKVPS
ncbi:GrpB family protein [Nesterenkonia muleiensis]|uniref:GrpB family protein n=1 Tax=Nesterenkonia muleiensis TaxID=2282648 RepID=UPI000E753EAC|nr:GrpB family protein [Nesterenkonia muleiensis]